MEEVELLLFTIVNKERVIYKRDIEAELLKKVWTLKTLTSPKIEVPGWLCIILPPGEKVQDQLPGLHTRSSVGRKLLPKKTPIPRVWQDGVQWVPDADLGLFNPDLGPGSAWPCAVPGVSHLPSPGLPLPWGSWGRALAFQARAAGGSQEHHKNSWGLFLTFCPLLDCLFL